MANLAFKFGDRWKNLNQLPTVEHSLFFQYLVVSPSYWKAHLIRKGVLNLGDKGLPKDIKLVLKTYDLFGDIFTTPFEIWWERKGCDLFYSGTATKVLNVSLDLAKTKAVLLKQVELKISEAQQKLKKADKPKISLLINKINSYSLFEKLRLIEEKALAYREGRPNLENWRIALISNLRTKWKKGINEDSRLTAGNEKARAYLGMLVSKNIAEAVAVAENAARGNFPSKEGAPSRMRLDYEHLAKVLYEQGIAEVEYIFEMGMADKPIKHGDYAAAMLKELHKKMRSRKRFEKMVDQEIARRAQEENLPLD